MSKEGDELKAAVKGLQEAIGKGNDAKVLALQEEINTMRADAEKHFGKKTPFELDDVKKSGAANWHSILHDDTIDPEVKAMQRLNDEALIVSAITKCDPRSTKAFGQLMAKTSAEPTMASVTATLGDEWVPTLMSAEIIDLVRVIGNVRGLHAEFTMPSNPYVFPVVAADTVAYVVAESTDDSQAKYPLSNLGTGAVTFTAKKFVGRALVSNEADEDAIRPMVPEIMRNMATAQAVGVEQAIINGDIASSHMDTDVTAASDARKHFKGYRASALAAAKVDLATLTAENVGAIKSKLGIYGVNPADLAWVTSPAVEQKLGLLKDASGDSVYLRYQDTGNASSFNATGELDKLLGIPVVYSGYVREDLNASGVADGTVNTKGILMLVYRPAFRVGVKRDIRLTSNDVLYSESDQTVVISNQRLAFDSLRAVATQRVVGLGYNIGL